MDVGIIGGTGPAGQAVALRLADSGHSVVIGSRDQQRSRTIVKELSDRWQERTLELASGTNEDAAAREIVVLGTPWEGAVSTVLALAEPLAGKVLISMVNALARVGGEFQALTPARGSISASLQAVLVESAVTTAFQHLPARELGAIDRALDADVMICSDTFPAFEATSALVDSVDGLRGVFCGSLASATSVEAMTAVLLNINVHYKVHASVRLTGLVENG